MTSSSELLRMPRCKICNNLKYQGQQQSEVEDDGVYLTLPFSKLDRGCPFCLVVILSIESVVHKDYWNARIMNPENGEEMFTDLYLYLVRDEPIRGRFKFKYHDTPRLKRRDAHNTRRPSENSCEYFVTKFLIYSADKMCPILPSLATLPPFRRDVTLECAASLVRRGQIYCSQNHESFPCSRQPSGFVPTRLIKIGPQSAPLRLVESIAVPVPYATLSYCWGAAKPLSSTKVTLSARLHHIPENCLPIVFRQAIQLARKLEIPYIWIDSLCIIQDSVEDWETESERMSLYYQNGSLNIAAAASDNPDTPFIRNIDETWCPKSLKIDDPQGTTSLIKTRRLPNLTVSNRDLGNLFTRAWALQESFFSPSTVNFTTQGVIWSCYGQNILSDNYLDSEIVSPLHPGFSLHLISESSPTLAEGSEKPGFCHWRQLLENYTSRLLTFPTDKLPAISGAAAYFYRFLHCSYLAGHWYDDLPQSLVWSVIITADELRPLPRDYVAPSWSWASVTQGIHHSPQATIMNSTLSSAVRLVEVHCDVAGKSPYGRVSNGFIVLRGKVAPAAIGRLNGSYHGPAPDWFFDPDCTLTKSGDRLCRGIVGEAITDFEAGVCCVYLASGTTPNHSRHLSTHYALVLGYADPEKTSFIRLGLLTSISESGMKLFDGAVERNVRIV